MDNLNEKITGVSLNFTYQNYEIKQSGLLFNDYVLTTGGLVLPYVLSNKVEDIKSFDIKISLEKNGRVLSLSGFIAYVCYSNDLNNAIIKNDMGLDSISIKSFSHFLFIRIDDSINEQFTNIGIIFNQNELCKGQDVLTVSTPFGNHLFLNCYSSGIISNIVDRGLFITDSRLSPGCEGGPIYNCNGSIELVGLVLTQFMLSSEYTGFNLCCNIYIVYEAYCRHRSFRINPFRLTLMKEKPPIHRVSNCVLPIKTPSTRGSGILLNEKGLLVTCSHVINYGDNTHVEVTFSGKPYSARILCCTSKDDILDLAFLQINADIQMPSCTFSDISPIKGPVYYLRLY
ncbi:uncharacterized protein [Halyomorpha halys]|uniref:uncharacterized protein isoform X2 n=1 Tax=Halyomorpha halys TaxID=286706 RepID=UPI0006D51F0A|nr:uncharacterized protein LOC106679671 isoform X2 [Halyomorpha halys]